MPTIISLSEKQLPDECFVFKHSTRCPVSAAAAQEVRSGEFDQPLYWINVVEQRELSNWVAERYKVPHQSPQLIRIRGGEPSAVLNHGQIRRGSW